MNEDSPIGKVLHQQIKLPIFPVYYDLFFCDDMWMAPSVISDRYPGVHLDIAPHTTSMTSLIKHPLKGTGIAAIFVVNEETKVKDSLVFEASNITWLILEELGIDITLDNNKIFSYILEEINREISSTYENFKNLPSEPDDPENNDLDDLNGL
ncbi:MAG: hypothetical protein CMM25_00500 [Rhodospirillaceae bacterium]|nr:hypothetical protein [Rhodospirillaceae bacterium]